MAKKIETYYDNQGQQKQREVGQDEDVLVKAKVGTTAGKGLGNLQKPADPGRPNPRDFPNNLEGWKKAHREYMDKKK